MRIYVLIISVFVLMTLNMIIGNPVLSESDGLNPEIIDEVHKQIKKEKKFGYDDFELVYHSSGPGKVTLLYTATNNIIEPGSKYLSGYTVSKAATGEWIYVGSKTVSYSDEKDLENMKLWADDTVK